MKVARTAVAGAVDRPDPTARFYLFHGPDEAGSRHLAGRLLAAMGAEKFAVPSTAIKADPAVLADEASAMALFGGPRAIWIEPAADEISDGVTALLDATSVESPVIAIAGMLRKSSALLKLAEGHKGAAAIISYVPEGRAAEVMVVEAGRAEGLRVEPDVAARLAAACSANQAIVAKELAKFALFLDAAPDRPRPLGHEVINALGADSAEGHGARLGDLALAGDSRELLDDFGRASIGPSDAIPVVRAMQRRLLQLAPLRARIERGERPYDVMASVGKALFFRDKGLIERLLSTWSAGRIAQVMERGARLERAMMSDQPPVAALGEGLVTIARAAQRRR